MNSKRRLPGFLFEFSLNSRLSPRNQGYKSEDEESIIPQQLYVSSYLKVRSRNLAPAGFQCQGLRCSCQGDLDCNDLFSTDLCGPIASCDNNTGVCECLRLFI